MRAKGLKNKSGGIPTPEKAQIKIDHPFSAALPADTIAKLRAELDQHAAQIAKAPSGANWTRHDVINILQSVSDFVDLISTDEILSHDAELKVIAEHPAATVLKQFIDALKDLDHGHVDERLKPTGRHDGAALTAAEKADIILWLGSVEILRRQKRIYLHDAERNFARGLGKAKVKHCGDPVTAQMLRRWRKTYWGKGHKAK